MGNEHANTHAAPTPTIFIEPFIITSIATALVALYNLKLLELQGIFSEQL